MYGYTVMSLYGYEVMKFWRIFFVLIIINCASKVYAQSVIHYVSNSGNAVAPPSGAFLDVEDKVLTVQLNTYADGMGTLTLSGDVAKFATGALNGMDLLYVTVPATVTLIGKDAFNSCNNLKAVLFESAAVPTAEDNDSYAFSSTNMTIYAPLSSYDSYNTGFSPKTGVTYVSCWKDITLNSSGMGTFGDTSKQWLYYSAYNKNQGLTAYRCSGFTETTITFSQTYSSLIGKGVVLVGSQDATYRLLETKDNLTDVVNYMTAADGNAISDATGKYILTSGTKGIGFYPLKSGTIVAAGKAYLDLGTSSAAKFLSPSFEDISSSIELINYPNQQPQTNNQQPIIYNIAGQRVGESMLKEGKNSQRSIVIINGKKYLSR